MKPGAAPPWTLRREAEDATTSPTGDDSVAAPERPGNFQERVAARLFRALTPRLDSRRQPRPPRHLGPWSPLEIARPQGGALAGTWYPADGEARGAVLLAPPWTRWGQAFFHRGGRIEALRAAGYHALSFDFGGFGNSGPAPAGFYDTDVEAALEALRQRAGTLPVHVWGLSFGGYWTHPVLSRTDGVRSAIFEDVACHLIEWSKRMAPWGYPCYLFFQHGLDSAYRFLDLRRHAAHLKVRAVAYASGDRDPGILPDETRELARRAAAGARAESSITPGAGHLESIRCGRDGLLRLALETLESSEAL